MYTSILLPIVIASAAVVSGQAITCPALYHPVGNGCYLFPTEQYSWFDASLFCYFAGGYLVKIDNIEEEKALKIYLETVDTSNRATRWIGACDSLSNGTYRWVPSGQTLEYQNWYPAGYPSNAPGKNCAAWTYTGNYWLNNYCSEHYGISPLCEAKPLA